MENRKLKTGMIAFERSIQVSEALLSGLATGANGEIIRRPVQVLPKGVRGQTSNAFKNVKEGEKQNAGKSNPQIVDSAVVPAGCEKLEISFNVRVLGKSMAPSACDDLDVTRSYRELASLYAGLGGYRELAQRFVWNIANGRFSWRNRYNVDNGSVVVLFDNREIRFDYENAIGTDAVMTPEDMIATGAVSATGADPAETLEALVSAFADALANGRSLFLKVVWTGDAQQGQEVFPSQEYVGTDTKKGDVSRVYAKLPVFFGGQTINQASIHSQKIGAALRWFDDWHGTDHGVVPVNAYSGIQETGEVIRWDKKGADNKGRPRHLYEIRDKAEPVFAELEQGLIGPDTHFLMANLVRGGVMGAKDE